MAVWHNYWCTLSKSRLSFASVTQELHEDFNYFWINPFFNSYSTQRFNLACFWIHLIIEKIPILGSYNWFMTCWTSRTDGSSFHIFLEVTSKNSDSHFLTPNKGIAQCAWWNQIVFLDNQNKIHLLSFANQWIVNLLIFFVLVSHESILTLRSHH